MPRSILKSKPTELEQKCRYIKSQIVAQGMTQRQIAKELGIKYGTLNNWLNSRRGALPYAVMARLMLRLDVPEEMRIIGKGIKDA